MLKYFAELASGSALNLCIAETYWLWPVLEIVHFIGLTLLLGGLIIVDLRMAGHLKSISHQASHALLRFVILGFLLNLVTGVLFFYGDPGRYSINIGFQIKMWLVLIAGANALFYHWRVNPLFKGLAPNDPTPWQARLSAYTSLTMWSAVLLAGRLIPYVGTG